MKTYLVKYWSTEGRIVGMTVCAFSPAEAEAFVKDMPNYNCIADYPEEVAC